MAMAQIVQSAGFMQLRMAGSPNIHTRAANPGVLACSWNHQDVGMSLTVDNASNKNAHRLS
jgi:hypothetical protein